MSPASDLFTSNLPGLVLLILIIAVPLALLTSVGILSLYRRVVLRGMRSHANVAVLEPASTEVSELPSNPMQTPLRFKVLDTGSRTPNNPTSNVLYRDLLRGPWRAATIYAAAGFSYALVTTVIFLRATQSPFHLLSFLIIFWYYAWPVAVTISLVAAANWRTRLSVFAIYFLIIVALGVVAVVGNAIDNWLQIVWLWLFTNFPAALLLLAFLNRRIQAVGPLVLTFMIFAVTGAAVLPPLLTNNERLIRLIIHIGVTAGLGGFAIYLTLLLLGFTLFGAIGWLVLQAIGYLYRHKKISEQSITIDAIWLLFGIFQSIDLIFEGVSWFLISLLAFAVYKVVAWVGFTLVQRKAPSNQRHANLLVLRVFSLGKRSERLFDVLAMYWRFVGSIRLIAGPDLATTTMEPHEFLDFLSGRLTRRFIDNARTLDLRISQMDLQPVQDGQFRVNDFFCYDDTWRMVLSRLVRESDAVIMDLRGFSPQNAGCIFEITELFNLIPLGRVLFIIDNSTDQSFLHNVMQQSWEHMASTSPNRQSTSGEPILFRLNRLATTEIQDLLSSLAAAAKPTPETPVAM